MQLQRSGNYSNSCGILMVFFWNGSHSNSLSLQGKQAFLLLILADVYFNVQLCLWLSISRNWPPSHCGIAIWEYCLIYSSDKSLVRQIISGQPIPKGNCTGHTFSNINSPKFKSFNPFTNRVGIVCQAWPEWISVRIIHIDTCLFVRLIATGEGEVRPIPMNLFYWVPEHDCCWLSMLFLKEFPLSLSGLIWAALFFLA